MNLEDVKAQYGTERACREKIASLRWKDGYTCPKCGSRDAWITAEVKYKCQKCGHKQSVTAGAIFESSHVPLPVWFEAIWLLCCGDERISANAFQDKLKLGSNRTAQVLYKIILEVNSLMPMEKLSGTVELLQWPIKSGGKPTAIVIAVELSEKRITRKILYHSRSVKHPEIEPVEKERMYIKRHAGRICVEKVVDRTEDSIIDFLRKNVKTGSIIITKGWKEIYEVGYLKPRRLYYGGKGKPHSEVEKIKPETYRFVYTDKIKTQLRSQLQEKPPKSLTAYLNYFCRKHNAPYLKSDFEDILGFIARLPEDRTDKILSKIRTPRRPKPTGSSRST